jgi:anti-sigma factor RsiW
MMSQSHPPGASEDDLHAYVDGRLAPDRRAGIERWLAENPAAAAEVAGWQRQNERIRAAFAAELPQADDAHRLSEFARARPPRRSGRRIAAVAAAAIMLFGLGAGAGFLGGRMTATGPQLASIEALPEAARASYLIYTREVRHPVEVGADQEAHLVAWLGKRLGSDIVAPDLTSEGFRLVGGRLIPYRDKPGALLMYEDEKGERLTILFGRNEQNTTTGFRFESSGSVQTFYWIDGPVGYAISGEIDRDRLQRISDICYRQL